MICFTVPFYVSFREGLTMQLFFIILKGVPQKEIRFRLNLRGGSKHQLFFTVPFKWAQAPREQIFFTHPSEGAYGGLTMKSYFIFLWGMPQKQKQSSALKRIFPKSNSSSPFL